MRALYRIGQGLRALSAGLRPTDDQQAQALLAPPLYALYRTMRRAERQHSLRVLADLRAEGYDQPELLAAALLHDVGKSRAPFTIPEKVLVVLARALAPERAAAWGRGPARGLRRPFAVSAQHPAWGAEIVAAAGGSPLLVELIRRHAEPLPSVLQTEADRLLWALQRADNRR